MITPPSETPAKNCSSLWPGVAVFGMILAACVGSALIPFRVSSAPQEPSRPESVPQPAEQSNDDQRVRDDAALQAIASELRAIREQTARIEQQRAERDSRPGPPIYSNWFLILVTGGAVVAAFKTLDKLRQQVTANIEAANAARTSADIAATTIAITQRGFVHIGGWGKPSLSETQSLFPYKLTCRGHTEISIEWGEITFSGQGDFPGLGVFPDALGTHATYRIPAQAIGPFQKGSDGQFAPLAEFPAVKDAVLMELKRMSPSLKLFLTGSIWYRDAFPNTPRHIKRFGVVYQGGEWRTNPVTANDEGDEPQRQKNAHGKAHS